MADTWTPSGGSAITFETVIDGRWVEKPTPTVMLTKRAIPGSNGIVYVDAGGRDADELKVHISLASQAVYTSFKATTSYGMTGTLVYQGITYTAILNAIANVKIEFAGGTPRVECDASWWCDPT